MLSSNLAVRQIVEHIMFDDLTSAYFLCRGVRRETDLILKMVVEEVLVLGDCGGLLDLISNFD